MPCASLGRSLPVPRGHGVNVTRSNGNPHDTVQKRGGNVQLRRPGGLLEGVTGQPCRSRLAVQVEVGSRLLCGGNATLGASYQSSLVRGNMSTFVPSSPATHLQAYVRAARIRREKGTGIGIGRKPDQTSGGK